MDGCDDGAELRLEDAIAFRKRRIGSEQVGKQEGRKGWWNGASECCRFRTLRRKRSFLRRKRRRVHGGHELFEGRLAGNEGLDILGRCSELRIDFLQRGRRWMGEGELDKTKRIHIVSCLLRRYFHGRKIGHQGGVNQLRQLLLFHWETGFRQRFRLFAYTWNRVFLGIVESGSLGRNYKMNKQHKANLDCHNRILLEKCNSRRAYPEWSSRTRKGHSHSVYN